MMEKYPTRKMKVMFLFQGLPHYYNYVLNRLHALPGVEIINVVPKTLSPGIGDGVFQTKSDIKYTLIELEEYRPCYGGFFFRNFWKKINNIHPDIIITTEAHLRGFLFDLPTLFITKWQHVSVILKTHPFLVPVYHDIRKNFKKKLREELGKSPRFLIPSSSNPIGLEKFKQRAIIGICDFLRIITCGIKCLLTPVMRFFYQFPDACVCYIEEAYNILGSYGVDRKKIFITYNSPDTDRLLSAYDALKNESPSLVTHAHRLIHVGRLVEWKRVDLLLIAVANLKNKYPDIELLILGDGPQKNKWIKFAEEMHILDRVKFLGGIYDPKELGRHMISSAIYVLAGMGGLSINEAMCFGKPVICSTCDGTEKHLVKDGQNGLYFKSGDATDLAEKIDHLFQDPNLRERMGQISLNIVRTEINIQTVINGYIKSFEYVSKQRIYRGREAKE